MVKITPVSDTLDEMEQVRSKIRTQIVEINLNLKELNTVEIERRTKALSALFKLTQAIDEQAERTAARLCAQNENKYTPYDQMPPPAPAEMQLIRDRFNRLYTRLRAAEDPDIRSGIARNE